MSGPIMEAKFFSEYKREELLLLKNFIVKETRHTGKIYWGLPVKMALHNCLYDPRRMSVYNFEQDDDLEIFTIDMNQLPLYINDEDIERKAIAKWRLFIGK